MEPIFPVFMCVFMYVGPICVWVCTHTPVVARGPPQGSLFTLVFETVSLFGLGLALIENQVQNVALRQQKQFEMQPGEEMAMCRQPLLRGVLTRDLD